MSVRHKQDNSTRSRGLTLVETLAALALIAVLVSILWPALSSARVVSHRDRCQANQATIGEAWQTYLADHNGQFPYVPVQPGWLWGGMRVSSATGTANPDFQRPLTQYMNLSHAEEGEDVVCLCPADAGITDMAGTAGIGTGRRTAFASYGTSYRANAELLYWQGAEDVAGGVGGGRSLSKEEITTSPARLLLMGDPVWYEVIHATGRNAVWHKQDDSGNVLFLDGSVRFVKIERGVKGANAAAVMVDPFAGDETAQSKPAKGTSR